MSNLLSHRMIRADVKEIIDKSIFSKENIFKKSIFKETFLHQKKLLIIQSKDWRFKVYHKRGDQFFI